MRIAAVDLFYLAMPVVTEEADGSQDALLVCVREEGGLEGWGECEASPLTSIAAFVCPMSHGVCRPVADAVLGQRIEGPADIRAVADLVGYQSMDLLQAAHTLSGVEMALWDLLGRQRGQPVWRELGYAGPAPKTAYASQLFGDDPQATLQGGRAAVAKGFRAVKFGWGPFGQGTLAQDVAQLEAAREGIGPDAALLVDAGQIWGEDVGAAAQRLPALDRVGALWLEEPFAGHALDSYAALARQGAKVRLAGGEAAHNFAMAQHLIDRGGIGFVQIDCGRIGGIAPAHRVARYAREKGVTYVNHTFTSHLALSASLQPYAGLAEDRLCEFPVAPKQLALDITREHLAIDSDGQLTLPDRPGLGLEVATERLAPYLVETEIRVRGKTLYRTPSLD